MPLIKVLRIKYLDPDMPKIVKTAEGDWVDLRSREEISYTAGEIVKVPLGVAMELPSGYEAHILPRSSTLKNYGLILGNSQGIVDETYNGDGDQWFAVFYALKAGKIEKYDRICQFRIMQKMPRLEIVEVDELGNEDRGGYGHSGVK